MMMDQEDKASTSLAVVGARGVLGRAFLDVLSQDASPFATVFALGSEDSEGESVPFGRYELSLAQAATFDFSQTDWVVMAALSPSAHWITERALAAGARVLDLSSQAQIPRYWANSSIAADCQHLGMPDAMSVILARVLRPLHQVLPWRSADIVTFEAVSAHGQMAVDELAGQTAALFNQQPITQEVFAQRIAFNILPMNILHTHHLASELAEGLQMAREMFTVRRTQVPVFFGHCASIHLQFAEAVDFDAVRDALEHADGVVLLSEEQVTPMTVTGRDEVFVAQMMPALEHANSLVLWCAADNARAGVGVPAMQALRAWLADFVPVL